MTASPSSLFELHLAGSDRRRNAVEESLCQSEQRLAAILDSMDDLVFVLDPQGRFMALPQREAKEKQLLPPSEFVGRNYRDVLPADVAEKFAGVIRRIEDTGETQTFDYALQIAGVATWWSARASPLRDHDGRLHGTVVVTRDVTAQKLAEEKLQVRNRYLECAAKISTLLLAGRLGDAVFDRVAAEVATATGFSVAGVVLCDSETDRIRIGGISGFEIADRAPPGFRVSDSLNGRIIRSRAPVVIVDPVALQNEVNGAFLSIGLKCFAGVPIVCGDAVLGTLCVGDTAERTVEDVLLGLLTGLANQVAVHMERLNAESARLRNESELKSIYDHAPVIMALLDEKAGVIRSNRAAAEFAGLDTSAGRQIRPGELLGCLGAIYDPQGCGHGPACGTCVLRRTVLDTIRTGATHRQVEVRKSVLRRESARDVDLLVSTAPLDVGGERRVLLVMEDVTKARTAEARVREQAALLDVTHDAIFVHDQSGRVIYWNKGAERMYGWPRDDALGRRTTELFRTVRTEQGSVDQPAPAPLRDWAGEVTQETRDGRTLTVQSRVNVVRDDDGHVRSALVVNTDVSENRRLNSQLLRAQRLESIGTVASGIAHDLNNVLSPVMMSLGMLRGQGDASTLAIIETIEGCVKRGADIVKQVLTFARGVEGERIALSPRRIMNEIVRIVRETFPRAIEVSADFCRDSWSFMGDPTQIEQVLLNMCVNARDAMPYGGRLSIAVENVILRAGEPRIHPSARPGRYAVFRVADTGTGIAPESLEKIFDPFFTTKPLGQGTGLGLATSLGIVEKHGGFIQVESRLGLGACFRIFLPACDVGGDQAVSKPAAAPRGNGETILVVDDEPAVRMLTRKMLESSGYRVVVACDGRDAIDFFMGDGREVVATLTDLMMPRFDGAPFIEELRKLRPGMPVLAMTGVGEERRVQEATAAGVDAVLSKPFGAEELLQLLGRVINSSNEREQE